MIFFNMCVCMQNYSVWISLLNFEQDQILGSNKNLENRQSLKKSKNLQNFCALRSHLHVSVKNLEFIIFNEKQLKNSPINMFFALIFNYFLNKTMCYAVFVSVV